MRQLPIQQSLSQMAGVPNSREFLSRCGVGFGSVAMAGLLASESTGNDGDKKLVVDRAVCKLIESNGSQTPAFCSKGQSRHPFIHERWTIPC